MAETNKTGFAGPAGDRAAATAPVGVSQMADHSTAGAGTAPAPPAPQLESAAGEAGAVGPSGAEAAAAETLSVHTPNTSNCLEEKHPLAIRWLHWINFPVLAVMLWSGLLIYWAHDVYRAGAGSFTLFHFFPSWFYQAFNIDGRLAEGMAWHFLFMWIFAINGALYVLYTAFSGEWRYLVPDRKSFAEAVQITLHDLHLSKAAPPRRKFNGAQQIAYTAIIMMGAGSLVTGLAIYKPIQLSWLVSVLGGYQTVRFEHFLLAAGYVAFFIVHIAQVIRAGWSNFRSMVAGFEIVPLEQEKANE